MVAHKERKSNLVGGYGLVVSGQERGVSGPKTGRTPLRRPIRNRNPLTTNHQPLTAGHQPETADHQPTRQASALRTAPPWLSLNNRSGCLRLARWAPAWSSPHRYGGGGTRTSLPADRS